jgi:hypothetical protein
MSVELGDADLLSEHVYSPCWASCSQEGDSNESNETNSGRPADKDGSGSDNQGSTDSGIEGIYRYSNYDYGKNVFPQLFDDLVSGADSFSRLPKPPVDE